MTDKPKFEILTHNSESGWPSYMVTLNGHAIFSIRPETHVTANRCEFVIMTPHTTIVEGRQSPIHISVIRKSSPNGSDWDTDIRTRDDGP